MSYSITIVVAVLLSRDVPFRYPLIRLVSSGSLSANTHNFGRHWRGHHAEQVVDAALADARCDFEPLAHPLCEFAGGGALLAYLATTYASPASLESWGWRIPFILGILIGPFGYWLRSNIDETPEFQRYLQSKQKPANTPLAELFTNNLRELVVGFCIVVMGTVSYYVMLLYVPIYAVRQLGIPMSGAQLSSVLSTALIVVVCPLAGSLSDRIGRRIVVLPATVVYAVVVWLAVQHLLAEPSLSRLILAQMTTSLVMAFIWGPTPVLLMELFPVGVRSTGVGLIYNVGVALFGGLAPFAITWLISATGDKMSPVYYVVISAVVGVLGLLLLRERRPDPAVVSVPVRAT